MNLNLDDIAQLAGVSRATVSRVINNHPDVSSSTRQKVRKIIAEYNFSPNPAARMLATQRTRIIGVAICSPVHFFKSDYGSMLFDAISAVTNERDYATLMYWEQSHSENDHFSQRILQQNRLMDGMLLASIDIESPLLDRLVELKVPFVMMEKPTRYEEAINYVTIDNIRGAQAAVEHLIGIGRTRIAHIVGLKHKIDAQDRLTGYSETLRQHDLPFDPALIAEGSVSRDGGYAAMRELLARGVPIDAVFVSNDEGAEGALQALHEAGLRVPDDVALVGFDDVPLAQQCTPQLTTVHQPIEEKGAQAAALLLEIVEGSVKEPQHIILPTHLVIRQSCGAHV